MEMRAPLRRGLTPLLVLSALGCATSSPVGRTPENAPIVQISLPLSNAYLVKSTTPVLIDAGSEGDMDAISDALAENGTAMRDVGLVVITHGHSDHAGGVVELREASRAKILVGAGDRALMREGHNDELNPMNLTAHFIKDCIVPNTFPPFEPDHIVEEPVDLSPWGIDGKVIAMPGHTAGSLVVILSNRAAFVGDMILGGSLGGALSPGSPGEHYFHADKRQNRQNIATLVKLGVETFYLGHGGPVKREDVIKAFGLTGAGHLQNREIRTQQ